MHTKGKTGSTADQHKLLFVAVELSVELFMGFKEYNRSVKALGQSKTLTQSRFTISNFTFTAALRLGEHYI